MQELRSLESAQNNNMPALGFTDLLAKQFSTLLPSEYTRSCESSLTQDCFFNPHQDLLKFFLIDSLCDDEKAYQNDSGADVHICSESRREIAFTSGKIVAVEFDVDFDEIKSAINSLKELL